LPDVEVASFTPAGGSIDVAPPVPPAAPVPATSTPISAFFNPSPQESALLAEIRRRESSANYAALPPKPTSDNPHPTASGAYQFINSTWRDTSDATGVPQYATARQAPRWVQDVNALHLLRKYGANSSASWQASGPYDVSAITASANPPLAIGSASRSAAPTDALAGAPAGADGQDLLSRLAGGEDIDVTPQMIAQIINARPQALQPGPVAPQPAAPIAVANFQPAPAAPPAGPQPSALSRFGTAFGQSSGLEGIENLIGGGTRAALGRFVGNPDYDAERQFVSAGKGLLMGLAHEPGRISGEVQKGFDALSQGDINGFANSLYYAVPFFGGAIRNMADAYNSGDYAGALGHLTGIGTSILAGSPEARGATVAKLGEAAEAVSHAGPAVRGGVSGAFEAATKTLPLKKFGLDIPVPQPIITGAEGALAAHFAGVPKPVGAAVGAAAPVVIGAVRGARQALAERAAAEAVPEAAALTPEVIPVSRQLPAATSIITPPPEDTSFVRAVPAQYPEVEPRPGETLTGPLQGVTWDPTRRAWVWRPAAEPAAPAEIVPSAAAAPEPTLTPRDLVQEETGRPPSRQTQAQQAAAAETLAQTPAPEPAAAPQAPEAPAAVPEIPPQPAAPQAPARRPDAEIAAQLEATTRPDRMADFLVRNFDVTPADIDKLDPHDWQLVAQGAGSPAGTAPTPEDIAQVRTNVEAQNRMPATPAEAVSQFEAKRGMGRAQAPVPEGTSGGGTPEAAPTAAPTPASSVTAPPPAAVSPAEELARMMPEHAAAPQEAGARGPTASEARIETLAQQLAKGDIPTEHLATITTNPEAQLWLEELARSQGLARPAPGELPQILDRVQQLRGGGLSATAPAGAAPGPPGPSGAAAEAVEPVAAQQVAESADAARSSGLERVSDTLGKAADDAMDRMRKRGTFNGTRLNAGVPVEDMADMAIWGAAKLAKGVTDFTKWSKEMLADAGPAAADQIRPQLRDLFDKAQKIFARHINTTANLLPDTKKLLELYRQGKAGADWYRDTMSELKKIFGPDATMMVDFLAATSPNSTVKANVALALKAYTQWKLGQPFKGFLGDVITNLDNAAAGRQFGELKVSSFRKNLYGDPVPVTVDRWIARAMGFRKGVTEGQYKFMDYMLTQIANKNGMEPRQLQAAIWKAIKDTEGLPGQGGENFETLVKQKLARDPKMAGVIHDLTGYSSAGL